MPPQVVFYLISVLISATITSLLGAYALRQRTRTGAFPFALVMLCATLWSVTAALEVASTDLSLKILWFDVKASMVSLASVAELMLALEYSGEERWLHWKRFLWLSLAPMVGTVLLATNPLHHWMFSALTPETIAGIVVLNPSFTPLLLGYVICQLGYMLGSVWLFFEAAKRAPEPYQGQALALIVSLFIPIVLLVLYFLKASPWFPLDLMPIALVASGSILAWSLFRHQLFDITPVARDKVIESMSDGVVVVEAQGRIMDLNPVAQRVIRSSLTGFEERIVGERVATVLRAWPDWVACYATATSARVEIVVNENASPHIYDVDISPLTNPRGHLLGWVAIMRDMTEQKQTHERLQAQFAEIVSLQQQLTEQAIRDPLTNLFNRRYLEETLAHELLRASRGNYPVSVVMIDIDRFKNVNDTFGHQAGDLMLQMLARELVAKTRASDFVCRYGGEEFVVVMPDAPIEKACERAEQWRAAFEKLRVDYLGKCLQGTLSLGIAAFPAHGLTSEQVLHAADCELYAAKAAGRNCVRVAQA